MTNDNTAENVTPEGQPEAANAAADPVDQGLARIRELEAQLAEMKNEGLRHLAEAENTRKRAAKERDDTMKYAVSKFAKDMLDVADNLQRALAAVKPEMIENDPAVKSLFTGVEATQRQLTAVLERQGITKIDPTGQKFDPNHHQVVSEVDAPGTAPGTVVQTLQTGYMIHDRLLREAMVTVAKGGQAAPQSVDQKI